MPVFPALLQKSGLSKWWSSTYKSVSSALLRSRNRTAVSSTKKSGGYRYGSGASEEDYVELREGGSNNIQKHVQIEVRSMRENSINDREYLRNV
jgi:3-hydroxy-3-methylglutaryl CoA synthase